MVFSNDCIQWLCFSDIDECVEGSNDCIAEADCMNDEGTYHCDCKDGYTGNGSYCEGRYLSKMCQLNIGIKEKNCSTYWSNKIFLVIELFICKFMF